MTNTSIRDQAVEILSQIVDCPPTPPTSGSPPKQSVLLVPRVQASTVNQLVGTKTPTFTLNVNKRSTYEFSVDGKVIGQYPVNVNSPLSVSFVSPVPFSDGYHLITGRDVSSELVLTPVWFLVDTSVPPKPTPPQLFGGGSSTNVKSPTIIGYDCIPGYSIMLLDGSVGIGGGVADGIGQWSIATRPLAVGGHPLSATQTSLAGVASPRSDPFNLTIVA